MSKTLPLNLAKHPLLIKAFTGEDGGVTTEKVWNQIKMGSGGQLGNPYTIERKALHGDGVAPAPDLEELLDLAQLLVEKVSPDNFTLAEDDLAEVMRYIHVPGDRLTRLSEAIIAVLEETK